MVHSRLKGRDLDDYRPLQLAMGQLPHARVGTFYYNEMGIDVEHFVSKIEPLRIKKLRTPRKRRSKSMVFVYQVRLPEIYERGLIQVRYAKQRAQDIIGSWIYHLALCEVLAQKRKPNSVLILIIQPGSLIPLIFIANI